MLPAATAPMELWVTAAMLPATIPIVPNPIAIGINPTAPMTPPPIIAIVPIPKGIFLIKSSLDIYDLGNREGIIWKCIIINKMLEENKTSNKNYSDCSDEDNEDKRNNISFDKKENEIKKEEY